jgi:urate oxidase / 2-oxo-4-hydroxy-4-carboxy-5-ureidoimidazoline decarboxylase
MRREIRYGKAEMRCYRAQPGELPLFGTEITMHVFGDKFMAAYTDGDNTNVVATDTMKNFTHAALLEFSGVTHEAWVQFLAQRFLGTYPQMEWIRISERELPFKPFSDNLFEGPRLGERGVVELEIDRDGIRSLVSGIVDLRLVKLTGSAFANFMRDRYTSLPDRPDRPLHIYLDVHWRYGDPTRHIDPYGVSGVVKGVFDSFVSLSIQHLMNECGRVLLNTYPQAVDFSFEAQNRLWDTSMVSQNEPKSQVFSDPKPAHGLVGLTVTRDS